MRHLNLAIIAALGVSVWLTPALAEYQPKGLPPCPLIVARPTNSILFFWRRYPFTCSIPYVPPRPLARFRKNSLAALFAAAPPPLPPPSPWQRYLPNCCPSRSQALCNGQAPLVARDTGNGAAFAIWRRHMNVQPSELTGL